MNCKYCKSEHCQCCCKGSNCYFDFNEEFTCDGPLVVVDEEYDAEDWWWVHVCENHVEKYHEEA